MTNQNYVRLSLCSTGRTLAVLGLMATVASPAIAEPVRVAARQSPTALSEFSLDFGGMGGVSSARIARTEFEIEIDAAAGTARFLRYDQDIDPLLLPGGISTGAIRVELVADSSAGIFNPATGVFATDETYAIYFDGDLSAFGLTSPVLLPGASTGTIALASSIAGTIVTNWNGLGQLANPFDPNLPIDFSYLCTLAAAFAPQASDFIALDIIPKVLNLHLAPSVEAGLINLLNAAITAINNNNLPVAVRSLDLFSMRVARMQGNQIPAKDAQSLLLSAKIAMRMLTGGGLDVAVE